MPLILENITVLVGKCQLIAPFAIEISGGEIVTIMGRSGSGKSSLLAYIAGDLPDALRAFGTVRLDGADLGCVPPERRRIGRLFQDDLLFPHLTVRENLLFGMPRGETDRRNAKAEAALAEAGLAGLGDRAPHTLSGGERSRVALMRTLVAEPRAVLLDEPFSRLDAELRASMRAFVFSHLQQRGIPALLVTHDRADAPLGGRVLRIGEDGGIRDA